jgi:SAM-dependent methyltransferase
VAGDRSPRVSIRVFGQEQARIPTLVQRSDVLAAGFGADAWCGFEHVFQQPLGERELAAVTVHVQPVGAALPRLPGAPPFSLGARLFAGSHALDTTAPESAFLSMHYLRHNARRLEHLASLGLPLHGRSVIEFGAGVGDHSAFYLDRGCTVTATDARAGNLALLHERLRDHPGVARLRTLQLDVDHAFEPPGRFDIVRCYGLLYHLAEPAAALARMAACCGKLLLLETKADTHTEARLLTGGENASEVYHSFSDAYARPSRAWLAAELRRHFEHVAFTTTGPSHEEFPADHADLSAVPGGWPRTVLVASRTPLPAVGYAAEPPARLQPV